MTCLSSNTNSGLSGAGGYNGDQVPLRLGVVCVFMRAKVHGVQGRGGRAGQGKKGRSSGSRVPVKAEASVEGVYKHRWFAVSFSWVLLQRAAGWQPVLHRSAGRIAAFVSPARLRAALQGAGRRVLVAAPASAQQPSAAWHASSGVEGLANAFLQLLPPHQLLNWQLHAMRRQPVLWKRVSALQGVALHR